MAAFNSADWVIVAIFALSILAGIMRGLVREIIALITMIAAFVVAILFTNPLAQAITNTGPVQHAMQQTGEHASLPITYVTFGVSFALLFIGVMIIGAILGFFLNAIFTTGFLGFGNRLLGGLFGFIRGVILTLTLIFILQLTAISNQHWWHRSVLIKAYQPALSWLGKIVSPSLANLKEKFAGALTNMGSEQPHEKKQS